MGKVEKIVVLSVAFLIVVILAISTQGGGDDPVQAAGGEGVVPESADGPALQVPPGGASREVAEDGVGPRSSPVVATTPGRTSQPTLAEVLEPPAADPARTLGGNPEAPADRAADRSGDGEPPSLLLNSSLAPTRPVYEVPTEIPADWDLVTLAGLADHLFDPTLKVYTAQRNDTLVKIARRYYGDEAYVVALERNNEGLAELNPGHQLLIPVRAREILAEPADRYVVQDGESLWKIAKKVYGAGHRWGEIYEANRGVLSSPDAVTPGTTLRIP